MRKRCYIFSQIAHDKYTKYFTLMKIIIVNGPNLNLLGVREKSIYGSSSFTNYYETLILRFPGIEFEFFQSNVDRFNVILQL